MSSIHLLEFFLNGKKALKFIFTYLTTTKRTLQGFITKSDIFKRPPFLLTIHIFFDII